MCSRRQDCLWHRASLAPSIAWPTTDVTCEEKCARSNSADHYVCLSAGSVAPVAGDSRLSGSGGYLGTDIWHPKSSVCCRCDPKPVPSCAGNVCGGVTFDASAARCTALDGPIYAHEYHAYVAYCHAGRSIVSVFESTDATCVWPGATCTWEVVSGRRTLRWVGGGGGGGADADAVREVVVVGR